MWDPREDGVTHVNVYSKAATALGRLLSNFAHTPFECEDGRFASVEGYWYWLGTSDPRRERLRELHGYEAKRIGRELRSADWQQHVEFKRKIRAAIRAKLLAHRKILAQLRVCTLPLAHYYVFNGVVRAPEDGHWILAYLDEVRTALQSAP